MTLFVFLTVVQAIVAALLVAVILMQKSEGGGLGTSSGPTGFMSARGAADFMTRATAFLAMAFIVLSIILAALAVKTTAVHTVDTSLTRSAPAPAPVDAVPGAPVAPPAAPSDAVPGAPGK